MKSVRFKEVNCVIGKDQPEYQTLYGYKNESSEAAPMTVCMQLNNEELEEIKSTGQIWLTQITFGGNYRPILMSTTDPFNAHTKTLINE